MTQTEIRSFNTQPPEGGWVWRMFLAILLLRFQHAAARRRLGIRHYPKITVQRFQHAAARRRLVVDRICHDVFLIVSTRSRPKAAGGNRRQILDAAAVSTRSRPKAAGFERVLTLYLGIVSTRSRPKAAGCDF